MIIWGGVIFPITLRAQRIPPWGVKSLLMSLSRHQRHKVFFSEKKYLTMLDVPIITSGELIYHPPDFLEKKIKVPVEEVMIIDGHHLTFKTQGKTYHINASGHPGIIFFSRFMEAMLGGQYNSLNKFFSVSLLGSQKNWKLILHPPKKHDASSIERIIVSGKYHHVSRMKIIYKNNSYSVMTLKQAN